MFIRLQSSEKGIKLTDSNGKDLMRVLPKEVKTRIKEQKNRQFKQSYDDIRVQIVSHDVISFDIFDTLITRRVLEPEMVFDMVGRFAARNGICITDFRRERIKAQLESGLSNANLDEIYDQLAINTKITKEQAEQLKQEELKSERRVIIPREDIISLFSFALEAQKKIYLTTDMYLNRRHIVSLLNACSITGYYDILDSCEYRKLKLEGLFDELKAKNPGKSILHIGDSYINDCICAEVANIDSILISKSIDIAIKENKFLPDPFSNVSDKVMIGSLISHIHNSPFKHSDNEDQKWFKIGYSYIGPIVLSFIGWIKKNVELNKYDGILLSARDGYLIDKVFTLMKEMNIIDKELDIHYFYISRKAAVAMHTDEAEIINLLIDRTAPHYLPDRMMQDVFCMEMDHIKPYDFDAYGDNRYQYVWDQHKEVKDNVHRLKRNFYRYLGKEGLKTGGRYLFYDFVSSGTVQRSLASIVPFEMDGIYYQFAGEKDFSGELISRFQANNQVLKENYKTMENLMLSPEPSLWGYDENGDVIFCTDQRSSRFHEILKLVHQGAMSFTNHFLESFELEETVISDELTFNLISEMGEQIREIYPEGALIDDWLMGGKEDKDSMGSQTV